MANAFNSTLGGPIGQFINTGLQLLAQNALREKVPEPTKMGSFYDRDAWKPGGIGAYPGKGGAGKFTSPQSIASSLKKTFAGTPFPDKTGVILDEIINNYAAQIQKRGQEEEALGVFKKGLESGLGEFGKGQGALKSALTGGLTSFKQARKDLRSAQAENKKALAGTVGSTVGLLKDLKQETAKALTDFKASSAEFFEREESRTAQMVSRYATATQQSVKAQVEDWQAEAQAQGMPTSTAYAIENQIKNAGARDIGNYLGEMQVKREEMRDANHLNIMSMHNNLLSVGVSSLGAGISTGISTIGGAYATYSTNAKDIARYSGLVAEAEANHRAKIATQMSTLHSEKAYYELQGNQVIANMISSMTIPVLTGVAEVATDLLSFNIQEGVYNNDELWRQFEVEAGLTSADRQIWNSMFTNFMNMNEAEQQRKHEMDMTRMQGNYGLAGAAIGAGGSIAGGFAGRPPATPATG